MSQSWSPEPLLLMGNVVLSVLPAATKVSRQEKTLHVCSFRFQSIVCVEELG